LTVLNPWPEEIDISSISHKVIDRWKRQRRYRFFSIEEVLNETNHNLRWANDPEAIISLVQNAETFTIVMMESWHNE
jgi:hypothetical protein